MTQKVLHGLVLLLCFGLAGPAFTQDAMSVSDDTVGSFGSTTLNVTMDNAAPVQGFVIALGYPNTLIEVTSIGVAGAATAAGAELVVGELFDAEGGCTLGVVLDAGAPFDGQTIPAGAGQTIATIDVTAEVATGTAVIDFVDGVFNMPVLSNILVQMGLSIGAGQGLGLNAGTLEIILPPPALTIVSAASAAGGGDTTVPIEMDSPDAVQGFVLAIAHSGPPLVDININGTSTEAAGAEFVVDNIAPAGGPGGTLGVVLDFDAPFGGQTIPAGTSVIANFVYDCPSLPVGSSPQTSDLTFVDGALGAPALDNVIVVAGLSINPDLNDGTITCTPSTVVEPPTGNAYYCTGGEGAPGSTVEVCFFYTSETNLQGFQLAVCFDCDLNVSNFSIEGSIAEAVGAEFVNWNVDNDPDDGDGCELVAGILLDALPPFDGQTVPPTDSPLLIGCVDAMIKADAECDAELEINFCNGVDGAGEVPINNVVVIDFQSAPVNDFFGCVVTVSPEAVFLRGDCSGDGMVDIADPAAVLGEQFFGLDVVCEDACDANDDGKINLADAVLILHYLFKFGPPPAGGGEPGTDPTDDALDCTGTCG